MGQLKDDMFDFIVEIWKENGDQYPRSLLYDMLQGLSLHLQREKRFSENLILDTSIQVHNTLDNMMKEWTKEGVGQNKPEHEYISDKHEKILWEKDVLEVGRFSLYFVKKITVSHGLVDGLDFMVLLFLLFISIQLVHFSKIKCAIGAYT